MSILKYSSKRLVWLESVKITEFCDNGCNAYNLAVMAKLNLCFNGHSSCHIAIKRGARKKGRLWIYIRYFSRVLMWSFLKIITFCNLTEVT